MLYIITGPSGAGKTSFIQLALRNSKVRVIAVDVYSPSKREYECGAGRNRISKYDFERKMKEGIFSVTCNYLDNKYGFVIPHDYNNADLIYILDYPGDYPECLDMSKYRWHGILILPPSVEVLKERLVKCKRIDRIESAEYEYCECLSDIQNKKFNNAWTILINDKIADVFSFIDDLWGDMTN